MDKQSYVVLDIETTGLNPQTCEIIEIAAIKYEDGDVGEIFQTFVKSHQKIPASIEKLTGITNEMVSTAPEIQEVVGTLKRFIEHSVIVGHNIEFDLNFLRPYDLSFAEVKWLDTVQISRFAWPTAPGYRLESLKNQLNINIPGQMHRAEYDAMVTLELFRLSLAKLSKYGQDTLLKVLEFTGTFSKWTYFNLFSEIILRQHFFSEPIECRTEEDSYPTKDTSLFAGSLTAKKFETGNKDSLTEETILKILSPEGELINFLPEFKHRPQQIKMLTEIIGCFKEGGYAVIEAGTGTGKSMAYLLPALYWHSHSANRVVIATHTINLQEQLIRKDIPYIEKVLSRKINVAIVKGRSNYLCLKKWDQRIKDKGWLNEKELNFYVKCTLWLSATVSGDRSELNLKGDESEFWQEVSGDSDNCMGSLCKWFNSCFGMKARRKAESAELLIVNHSLVFADLKSGNNVLPEYKYIVIDEAHHLEDSATDYLGYEVSTSYLSRLLKFLRKDTKEGRPGLIVRTSSFLSKYLEGQQEMILKASGIMDDIVFSKKESELAREELINQVRRFIESHSNIEDPEQSSKVVRVRDIHIESEFWQSIRVTGENLCLRLNRLSANLEKLACFFPEESTEESLESSSLYKEIQYLGSSLKNLVYEMKFIFALENKDFVYWLQTGWAKNEVIMKAAPININHLLWEMFFKEKTSVILTSATLSVEGDFKYYVGKTGLDLAPPEYLRLLSVSAPFEYERQSMLCVVNDLPNPAEVDDSTYAREIAPFLAELAEVLKGRTLCLFSSHRLLKETYNYLNVLLKKKGINLLGHNIDGGRRALVEEFKRNGPAVLLGANSFWEGLDIPGELLSCVVVVKLPFSAPTIPTVEARVEQMELDNIDGFYNYSLPQAVIKLKQGFGRLIRRESDRGVVVILDKRVVRKRYGRVFLGSLPLNRHFKGEGYVVIQKIREWLDEGRTNEEHEGGLRYVNDYDEIDRFIKEKLQKN